MVTRIIKLIGEQKTVTAAGTREKLKTGDKGDVCVYAVTIRALATNTGNIYIGDETVDSTHCRTLEPRDIVDIEVKGGMLDLSEWWIDSAVNGEGVELSYLRDR